MTATTGILLLIIFVLLVCIHSKSDDIKSLQGSLKMADERLCNAENKIKQYENQESGIAIRQKECEKNISNMLEAANSIMLKANRTADEKIKEANRTAREILDEANKSCKSKKIQLLDKEKELEKLEREIAEKEIGINILQQNLVALPYMASIVADFDTRGLELLAQKLDWGSNVERAKKVFSIREIRRNTKDMLAKYKEAQYQLDYAIKMFPSLSDFLETDYRTLPVMDLCDISDEEHDFVRDYLTKEEYRLLSTTKRNQLALDRYRESHRKTNWQIGRDYELYVGYKYTQKGYEVDYFGSYMGLEDLGRDLIAKLGNTILIIQCKYWSSKKQIHENHINQLYGTMVCYCLEHNIPMENIQGVLVTNITLSETAKRFSNYLGISYVEDFPLGNYPCIKCNINRSQYGEITKIYHLPFDQQYDSCKINSPGEFYAMTVEEAEAAGFRRAFRWNGNT